MRFTCDAMRGGAVRYESCIVVVRRQRAVHYTAKPKPVMGQNHAPVLKQKDSSSSSSSKQATHLGLFDLDAGARLQQVSHDFVAHLAQSQLRSGLKQVGHLPKQVQPTQTRKDTDNKNTDRIYAQAVWMGWPALHHIIRDVTTRSIKNAWMKRVTYRNLSP